MTKKEVKAIVAEPVEVLESKVTVVESVSVDEIVEDIMNTGGSNVNDLISNVANKVTESILQKSESSLLEDDKEVQETPVTTPLNQANSKAFIDKVVNFLAGREFEEQCKVTGQKYNLPPKVVAKNFCLRILGTIGDVLGIAINVTRNFVKTTIHLLVSIVTGAVDLICDVAQGLASIITLNQTSQPKA